MWDFFILSPTCWCLFDQWIYCFSIPYIISIFPFTLVPHIEFNCTSSRCFHHRTVISLSATPWPVPWSRHVVCHFHGCANDLLHLCGIQTGMAISIRIAMIHKARNLHAAEMKNENAQFISQTCRFYAFAVKCEHITRPRNVCVFVCVCADCNARSLTVSTMGQYDIHSIRVGHRNNDNGIKYEKNAKKSESNKI